jgi:FlaA1/EpsC-like NDP-sugar epimerase
MRLDTEVLFENLYEATGREEGDSDQRETFTSAFTSPIVVPAMVHKQSIRRPAPALPDSVFKMFQMQGKVAIITGGSGGIGYQVSWALAEAGADVALWYNHSTQAEQLAASLVDEFGVKSKAYKCSVQNFDEVSRCRCNLKE